MLSDTAGRCGYKRAQDRANTSYMRLNTKAAGDMGSVPGSGRFPWAVGRVCARAVCVCVFMVDDL